METLTATTLRNIIGDLELDQCLTSRDVINTKLRAILDEATDPWGIKVTRVEMKSIEPPEEIKNAMKAVKAESSIKISGGTFTINSTDHAIHCKGTIDITGGTFNISSSAGKGISGHGNVTIDGRAPR